jgi:cell division protein FtsW (lipid II flippase)
MVRENLIKWFVISLTTISIAIATTIIPTQQSSRDRLLAGNIGKYQLDSSLTPEGFCRNSLELNFGTVNCDTADTRYINRDNIKNVLNAKSEVNTSIKVYGAILDEIKRNEAAGDNLPLIANLEKKIDVLTTAVRALKVADPGVSNKAMFDALLVSQGYSYNSHTNKFKKTNHNIARYAQNAESVGGQLSRLDLLAKYFGLFFALVALVSMTLLSRKVTVSGLALFGFSLLIATLSFIIVRDAAQNYAVGLPDYGLNPFRESLERQALVIVAGVSLAFVATLYGANPKAIKLNTMPIVRDVLLPISLLTVSLGAYAAFGPALGSETLKISVCLICASFLARFGRSLELMFDVLGRGIVGLLRFDRFMGALKGHGRSPKDHLNAGQYLHVYLIRSVILRVLVFGAAILIVTAVFGDLGGALVALLVFFFSLYLLLGTRFALSIAALLATVSLSLYLVSSKVQSRIQLMLEPMRANISDFGRLLQFETSSGPNGYGLGHIKWCSNDSVCIPLQSLSDYMPTIINATLGGWISIAFYLSLVVVLVLLSYNAFMRCWSYSAQYREVGIFSSLLCMGAVFQLLITLMGNLRVIPLTGLGLPLVSIGVSSFISASLGLGLAIGVVFKK